MPNTNRVTVYWDVTFDRITEARAANQQAKSVVPDMAMDPDDERDLIAVHEIVFAHREGLIDLDGPEFERTHSLLFDTLARLERDYPLALIAMDI